MRSTGLAEILQAFNEIGYHAEWQVISAYSVGAPHQRERIYIVFWRADIPYPNSFRYWEADPKKAETSQGWWAKRRFKRDAVFGKIPQIGSCVLQLTDGLSTELPENKEAIKDMVDRARVIMNLTEKGFLRVDHKSGVIYSTRIRGANGEERVLPGAIINGYIAHNLCYKGKKWQTKAHQIVWISKNGPVPDGYVIDHINRRKTDNRIDNLRIVTFKGNYENQDRSHIGISKEKKKEIALSYLESDMTMREVSDLYEISKSRVDQLVQEYRLEIEEYKVAMLGNSIIPQIAELIGRAILEHESHS